MIFGSKGGSLYLYVDVLDMIDVVFFLDACTSSSVLKTILFIETLLKYVNYILPMGLIAIVTLDFVKSVASMDEKEMSKNVKIAGKRIIYAMVFFLVPVIGKFAINMVSNTAMSDYSICLTNTGNIAYYEALEVEKKKIEEEKTKEWYASLDNDATYKKTVWQLSKNQNGSSDGVYNGQLYQLKDEQLNFLAAVANREQGSVEGAAAEASLMANLFELKGGSKYGTGADGLVNYVRNGGWFGSNTDSVSEAPQDVKDAVKKVLVSGQRTLPLYVDEHDCWYCNSSKYCSNGIKGDICTVDGSSDSIQNRSSYIQDKTIIQNVYGADYTFYTFPASDSDPFGYTAYSYQKIKGSN